MSIEYDRSWLVEAGLLDGRGRGWLEWSELGAVAEQVRARVGPDTVSGKRALELLERKRDTLSGAEGRRGLPSEAGPFD